MHNLTPLYHALTYDTINLHVCAVLLNAEKATSLTIIFTSTNDRKVNKHKILINAPLISASMHNSDKYKQSNVQ